MKTVENYLDTDKLLKLAVEPKFNDYSTFKDILDHFS